MIFDVQQIIPNLTITKHLLEYLHVEDGRKWGVNRSKISKHHSRKHAYADDSRHQGHRNTWQKAWDSSGVSHLLAANIPTDGTLGEMNFSQSVIRRCALPLR